MVRAACARDKCGGYTGGIVTTALRLFRFMRWPNLPHERLMQEIAVVTHSGHQFWGPAAIRYFTRRLPTLWWIMPLLHIPGSMLLWRHLYRWVARNRYRFSGTAECADAACALHR